MWPVNHLWVDYSLFMQYKTKKGLEEGVEIRSREKREGRLPEKKKKKEKDVGKKNGKNVKIRNCF